MSSKPILQGSFVLLWAGEDPDLHSNLLEQLQAADIPCSDKSLGNDEVAPTADPLPIDWKPRFGFEVAVISSDLAVAQGILEKLLGQEPADLEIPAQDEAPSMEQPAIGASDIRPTVEVWRGSDEGAAQFITAAMQENQIRIHLENLGNQSVIYASTANEQRAREIVREIVEGAPPE
jgi:hypothetical protein